MPPSIRGLADSMLIDPASVIIGTSAPAATVSQAFYPTTEALKGSILAAILKEHGRALHKGEAVNLAALEDTPLIREIQEQHGTPLDQRVVDDFDYGDFTPRLLMTPRKPRKSGPRGLGCRRSSNNGGSCRRTSRF